MRISRLAALKVLYASIKIVSIICFNRIDSRKVISHLLNYIVQLSDINKMQIMYYFIMEDFFSRMCNTICRRTEAMNIRFNYY